MKKKDILEYMNEVIEVPEKHADVATKLQKDNPEGTVRIIPEEKTSHEGKSCKEAHPNMSHSAWKKNMEESDTLDLNLLEKEIYEDIKNEEYGKMSKKDIMEMIGFSKVNESLNEDKEDKFELDYCPKCMAMKNHLDGVCQNCKKEKMKENEVETKPKVKPTTKPAGPKRRNSPFDPTPGKKTAPAKGGLTDAERKQIEDIIGTMDEGEMAQSIITITQNLLNV